MGPIVGVTMDLSQYQRGETPGRNPGFDPAFRPVGTCSNPWTYYLRPSNSRVRPGVSPRYVVLAQIRGLTTCFRWRTNFGAFVTVFRGRVADTSTQGLS